MTAIENWQVSGVRRKFGSVAANAEAHAVGVDGDEACLVFYAPARHAECWRDAQRIAKVPEMEREIIALRAHITELRAEIFKLVSEASDPDNVWGTAK